MNRPTCKTCPYWLLRDDEDLEPITPAAFQARYPDEEMIGECTRFPPIGGFRVYPVIFTSKGEAQIGCFVYELTPTSSHPETEEYESCGEHPDFPAWLSWRRSNT